MKPIILFCGLLGSGKTHNSQITVKNLKDYTRFNTDEVRRILGKEKFDRKDTPMVNEYMYSRTREIVKKGGGALFDSAYKLADARQRVYDLAKELSAPMIMIECVCSPETAILRMSLRKKDDALHSPSSDASVYYEYAKMWEAPLDDLNNPENSHVSLLQLDTEKHTLKLIKKSENYHEVESAVEELKEILENISD